jgi:hypothetical protein
MYTLAGFEPEIFCSAGGRDDHYIKNIPAIGFSYLTSFANVSK